MRSTTRTNIQLIANTNMGTTLSEYREALEERMSQVEITEFYSDAMKDRWINEAGRRVCNFHPWAWLNHALRLESEANAEYYAYPSRFKKNSIYRVTEDEGEDEEEHLVVNFDLYKSHKENETEVKVASQLGDQWFIYPIPEAGTMLGIYGQLKWVELSGDSDEAIVPSSHDEAIIKMALASALRKERRYNEANSEVAEVEGQSGILTRFIEGEKDQKPKGYMGRIRSSRWD